MYRIELSPGEETAFRSIEELAVAIRRGVVTPRARIWHNASGKWLSIQFHPHYKMAAAMQLTTADLVAGPPVKPLELLTLGEPMDPAPSPAPMLQPIVEPEQPVRAKRTPEAAPKPRKKTAAKSRSRKSSRTTIRIALGGALLVACAHLAFSAASAERSEEIAARPRTHRHLITASSASAQGGGPETTAAAVLPGLPAVPRPSIRSGSTLRLIPSASRPSEPATTTEASAADSEPAIQPAPASVDIAAPALPRSEPLAGKMVDSTGEKTLKRILRSIEGTSTSEQTRPKR